MFVDYAAFGGNAVLGLQPLVAKGKSSCFVGAADCDCLQVVAIAVVPSGGACRCHPFRSGSAPVLLLLWSACPRVANASHPWSNFASPLTTASCLLRNLLCAAAAVVGKRCVRWSWQTFQGNRVSQLRVGGPWW